MSYQSVFVCKNRDIEKAIYSIEQGYAEDDRQQVLKDKLNQLSNE